MWRAGRNSPGGSASVCISNLLGVGGGGGAEDRERDRERVAMVETMLPSPFSNTSMAPNTLGAAGPGGGGIPGFRDFCRS